MRSSNVDLLGNLDAGVAASAFNIGISKQQLDRWLTSSAGGEDWSNGCAHVGDQKIDERADLR